MKRLIQLVVQACATFFYIITVYAAVGIVIKILS